jgi:hypothetical protein
MRNPRQLSKDMQAWLRHSLRRAGFLGNTLQTAEHMVTLQTKPQTFSPKMAFLTGNLF